MRKLIPFICILIFGCKSQNKSDISNKLDQFLHGQEEFYRFNGNVLVAENGKTIFQHSFGMADFDSKRPLNDSSVFELASVSKQFTATAILLLKDKGKLKLTDSLRQYFPELPYSNITLGNMLTHTSGLPDYFWLMIEKWDHKKIAFNKDVITFLAKEKPPVSFSPGTKWEYSNSAFVLLASIVEKISGQSYKEYMSENIFKPLGMNHTQVYNTRRSLKDTIANYAYGYGYSDSLKKYILPDNDPDANFVFYMDGIQGDGIINSTTADLLKWDRAIKNHILLKEETQNEMLKKQALSDTAKKTYYGFGISLDSTEFGNIISHSGGWPGYLTYLARNTDKDQTYIVLSNNNSNAVAISNVLQHLLAGKPVIMPYAHKEIAMDAISMDQFTGAYKGNNDLKFERRGNKFLRVLPDGSSLELKPESKTKFFYSDGSDRQIEFEMDSNKTITKAWLIAHGLKYELKKII
ncbi:MAG: serine hydrolase domain-containing protein [Chitinophagaceae bacterium]